VSSRAAAEEGAGWGSLVLVEGVVRQLQRRARCAGRQQEQQDGERGQAQREQRRCSASSGSSSAVPIAAAARCWARHG
jgi:hypothetical protein